MGQLLYTSFSGGSGGGGGGFPDALPAGVPTPKIWYSARNVTLSGSDVTTFHNDGSGGATHDATVTGTGRAKIATPASWGSRSVIDVTTGTTRDYRVGSPPQARSIFAIATYKDGVDTTFDDFDSINGAIPGITGNSGSATLFDVSFGGNTYYVDGVLSASRSVLPMDKRTVAVTGATYPGASTVSHFLLDDGVPSRAWLGYVGEFMAFDEQLTSDQVADLHAAVLAYYS